KMFEYMAAGLQLVVSDFPAWRRIVDDAGCGLLVDPLDARAIARAIERLLRHPAEAEAMGRRGRAAILAGENWETESETLVRVYREIARHAATAKALAPSDPRRGPSEATDSSGP